MIEEKQNELDNGLLEKRNLNNSNDQQIEKTIETSIKQGGKVDSKSTGHKPLLSELNEVEKSGYEELRKYGYSDSEARENAYKVRNYCGLVGEADDCKLP